MTNLEYMKQSITSQINAMSPKEFYELIYLLMANEDEVKFDSSEWLTCARCKEVYGNCPDTYPCPDRFINYCEQQSK